MRNDWKNFAHLALRKEDSGDIGKQFSKYRKGSHTEESQDLFTIIPECGADNNGLKLQEARFQLNSRKNFLTVRLVQ